MRTLVLTSVFANFKEEVLKILPAPPNMLKVAFIMTAKKPRLKEDPDYVFEDKIWMEKMGFDVEMIDIEGKEYQEIRNELIGKDIIFVKGGNTYYLMKAMHECNFVQVIRELLDAGLIYIGESAGSIVCGPDIQPAGWVNDENNVNLKDLNGLFLVDFGIVVNFDDKMTEKMGRGIMMAPYKVKFLHDWEALFIRDNKVEVLSR